MRIAISVVVLLLTSTLASPVLAKRPAPIPSPVPEPAVRSVCLDPGHGGSVIGSSNQEYLEKNINLQVAQILKEKLIAVEYVVYMTREDDREISNADRYNYCNSMNSSILLSIHHNGSTNLSVDYTTSLYMKSSDVAFAREVTNTVSSHLGLPNNGISKFASGVLLKSKMPSTISEGFFLTNSKEYDLIKNGNRLEQEADALLAAINSYFN